MKNTFVITFAIGLAVIALAVAGIFYVQRGAHMELPGKIVKIRTVPIDEEHSVAVADFQLHNSSDYPFVVRTVWLVLEDADGSQHPGLTSSEIDAQRFFDGTPMLGPKFAKTLITQETVAGRATEDHMVLANFEFPEARLQARKRFFVRIEEVDGKIFELSEK
ncbi:MAG: hypothetical protein ABSH40_01670 [Bryobacteraceae bacterium]|jgi:hypothetical protein